MRACTTSICCGAGTGACIPAQRRTCAGGCGSTRGGGSACARYTRAHPPRELAGVWRTEGQGDALRLEYAVKQLTRREKLALLQRPDTAAELVSGGAVFEPVPGVTLDMCLEGTFHG